MLVNRDLNPLLASLPEKFASIHNHQIDAVVDVLEGFQAGRLVVLEAPTGTGKTLVAEIVRRMLDTRAVYVCHNKELQDQFSRDYPYSKVLYGRANYLPNRADVLATCEDCVWTPKRPCNLCTSHKECPYQVAKREAVTCPIPVVNSAYWLNETQSDRSRLANTGLVVMDEADTLDGVLMNQVEVFISERAQKRYGINPPRYMTKGYVDWAEMATGRRTI